ncbi:glycosyltransferase family 2 protein [Eisenbergiella sp.]
MEKLYIIIPAYNEEENIEKVIDDWYPVIERYNGNMLSRLIIIDDGSKDHTYELASNMQEKYPLLYVINKENSGHGATVLYGYNYALEHGADYIFQTDSDGQTLPVEFEQFWKIKDNYDMVIGHRNKREDGVSRIIVTKTLKLIIKMCFGVTVIDANTPFRLMKASTLKGYVSLVPDGFNLSNVIISVIYAKKELKVKYIPITFRPRQGGKNSINIRKIVKIGKQAIYDFKRLNKVISSFE